MERNPVLIDLAASGWRLPRRVYVGRWVDARILLLPAHAVEGVAIPTLTDKADDGVRRHFPSGGIRRFV
jgi:hypothetical protein